MKKTILFYNDAPNLGGHEIMSALIAEELSNYYRIFYFYSHTKMQPLLRGSIKAIRIPFVTKTGSFSILKNLNLKEIWRIVGRFKALKPDLVVIVHGAIDISLRGAIASRWLGIKTLSYLPTSYSMSFMGLGGGWFFDRYFALFHKLFHEFITINEYQKNLIRKNTCNRIEIKVIENCFRFDNQIENISPNDFSEGRIGIVGRLEYHSKGLEHFLELANEVLQCRANLQFVVIGDGPDRNRFEKDIITNRLSNKIKLLGWIDKFNDIFLSFDVLVITSLHEGVPLVLLESLISKKPVLARLTSGTNIFKQYLPDYFLYKDISEAVEKLANIEKLIEKYNNIAEELRERVIQRHNRSRFAATVREVFASSVI